PEGGTLEFTNGFVRRAEAIARANPTVNQTFVVVGFPVVTDGIAFFRLPDWEERSISQQTVVNQLRGPLFSIPGILAFPNNLPSLGASPIEQPVSFVLQTSSPYQDLQRAVDQFMVRIQQNPNIQNLRSDLQLNKPELRVQIDREKAANLGVDPEVIGRTLETMLGGRQVTRFKMNGK